jgi:hypothetical protein
MGQKTYNTGDSPAVTDLNINPAFIGRIHLAKVARFLDNL